MSQRTIGRRGIKPFIIAALSFAVPFAAGQTPEADSRPKSTSEAPTSGSEIEQLRRMIQEQQRQIDELKRTMAGEKRTDSIAAPKPDIFVPPTTSRGIGQIASTAPILPPLPAVTTLGTPLPVPQAAATTAANPCEADPDKTIPTFLRLGSVCIVPIGFMDFTPFWRDKNAGSSMGSNFGSVPYNNVANGNLSEFHFSQQNSRIGFRIDGAWKGAHFIGYNEFDFNGTSGSTSLAVSNGAIVPRLRLYWADVRKGKVEFLAGQSWSMLVPNRNGISALPGDLFYSQVVDINYIAGLTWTRQPGLRILYHPNKKVTFGFSAEQPDQYIGGSAGGSGITLPSATALSGLSGTQLDGAANISTGFNYLSQPGYTPDLIAKLAFDFPRVHFEVAGIESNFKTVDTTSPFASHTTQGAGLEVGFNVAVTKNVRLISNNFYSDGEGRYLFGQAPDLIVRADGSLSPVHSSSTIEGFEARLNKNNLLLYGYYSAIYIGRNVAFDANGTSKIGYGVANNTQNRAINEATFGFNQTMWSNPRFGGINLMGQYEYLERSPWSISAGNPKQTHDSTIYFNIRYTLPGGMPSF